MKNTLAVLALLLAGCGVEEPWVNGNSQGGMTDVSHPIHTTNAATFAVMEKHCTRYGKVAVIIQAGVVGRSTFRCVEP